MKKSTELCGIKTCDSKSRLISGVGRPASFALRAVLFRLLATTRFASICQVRPETPESLVFRTSCTTQQAYRTNSLPRQDSAESFGVEFQNLKFKTPDNTIPEVFQICQALNYRKVEIVGTRRCGPGDSFEAAAQSAVETQAFDLKGSRNRAYGFRAVPKPRSNKSFIANPPRGPRARSLGKMLKQKSGAKPFH